MKTNGSVYSEKSAYAFFGAVFIPSMRRPLIKCLYSIFYNFFFCQHRAAFLPGRIPISNADHPLDEKIPFVPSWVTIYIDFVHFWIRMLSFLLRRYGRAFHKQFKEFVLSMGRLYEVAAEVYSKNLSTTKRPFYIARPRFFVIHLLDPHLMCIPSLHVMIVIHTYTKFASIAKQLGEEENLKDQLLEIKQGALAISQAILYVKQHSVNCLPAAFYAMTCFSPDLFPPQEAEAFTELLFSPAPDAKKAAKLFNGKLPGVHPAASPSTKLPPEDQAQIKRHIITLYRKFLEEGKTAKSWEEPLLSFLRSLS